LIGSAVHASKKALLSGEHAAAIRDLLERRGVLIFPKIGFTDEEQIAFTKTLGTFAPELRGDDIYKVTLDTNENFVSYKLWGPHRWNHEQGSYSRLDPVFKSIVANRRRYGFLQHLRRLGRTFRRGQEAA
jgi:hypothetical protein